MNKNFTQNDLTINMTIICNIQMIEKLILLNHNVTPYKTLENKSYNELSIIQEGLIVKYNDYIKHNKA